MKHTTVNEIVKTIGDLEVWQLAVLVLVIYLSQVAARALLYVIKLLWEWIEAGRIINR